MSRFCTWVLAVLLAAVASTGAHAQGFLWPAASAPCNGTLQQCVDGVIDGAVISIDINAPTSIGPTPTSNLAISRNLILRAAPGRRPVFPNGTGIDVAAAGPINVTIDGLTLRQGGGVDVQATLGSGTAFVTIEHMRFEHLGLAGGGVQVDNSGAGNLNLRVRDNDYLRTGGAGNFAAVVASGGVIDGEIAFNRINIYDVAAPVPTASSSAPSRRHPRWTW